MILSQVSYPICLLQTSQSNYENYDQSVVNEIQITRCNTILKSETQGFLMVITLAGNGL